MTYITYAERMGKLAQLEQAKSMILRQLTKLLGELSPQNRTTIESLTPEQLYVLGEDLLNFTSTDDLLRWLEQGSYMEHLLKERKERANVDFEFGGIKYRLWRLDDTEFCKLRQDSVPIHETDYWFYRLLDNYRGAEQDKLDLPRLFVVLEYEFGKSGNLFDDWKGSFSFPFLLLIEKDSETLHYMMKIADFRGSVEYRFYKIYVEGIGDIDSNVYHKPFEEFPEKEIKKLIGLFYGFYLGYFRAVKSKIPVKPFFKKIDSNLIIYGYQDNDYFEEQYDNQEDYEAAVKCLENKYPKVPEQRNVGAMIQEIIQSAK